MDPHQRKVLGVAYTAYHQPGVQRSAQNVFVAVGQCCNDWSSIPQVLTPFTGTGIATCVCANRISFVFGLTGGSLVVDTACSSSLVATEISFKKLREGVFSPSFSCGSTFDVGYGCVSCFLLLAYAFNFRSMRYFRRLRGGVLPR